MRVRATRGLREKQLHRARAMKNPQKPNGARQGRGRPRTAANGSRIIIRLELPPESKQRLLAVSKSRGMTQLTVTSRVIEWFAQQSNFVQAAVLGQYPHIIVADVEQVILKHMAKAAKM